MLSSWLSERPFEASESSDSVTETNRPANNKNERSAWLNDHYIMLSIGTRERSGSISGKVPLPPALLELSSPSSRVLEKPTDARLVKEHPAVCETWKSMTVLTTVRHWNKQVNS
jgi:hypothetical protein